MTVPGDSAPLEAGSLKASAPGASASIAEPGMDPRFIDIFPWHDQFDTGFPELDEQHRVMVQLLNALASQFAFDPNRPRLDRILDELLAYIVHHLHTEEALWAVPMRGNSDIARHREGHAEFADNVRRLQASSADKPVVAFVEEMLTFLARGLATHILDHDQYIAQVVHGVQAGLTPEEAQRAATAEMAGPRRAVSALILDTYDALAANTAKLVREIVERKHVEASLHESEERFRTIVEQSPLGILLHIDGHVVQVNEAAARMFRYASQEDMLRMDVFENIAPEERELVRERAWGRLRGKSVPSVYETVGLRRDGSRFPLVLLPRTVRTSEGQVIAAFLMDGTEAQRAQETERSLTRTIKLLSRTNSLLVRATDEHSLLNGVCRLAVDVGGYLMAWVGYAENDAKKTVRAVAQYGYEPDYVSSAHITWDDSEHGQGPTGMAIRTGRRAASPHIAQSVEMRPWREAAARYGYQATVALPLKVDGVVIGAMMIYSASVDPFNAEELALLDELAYDLAYGIQSLRVREAKEAALRELKRESDKNRAILHNASDGVHILDERGHLVEGSDSFFAMLGYTRAELMGKHLSAWRIAQESPQEMEERFRQVLNCNARQEFQSRHRRKDGSILDVEISTFPLTIEGQRMLFNSSRDVTESLRVRGQLEQTTQHLRQLLADFDATLEAERTHIAREVHDELGQILTSLGFAISTIRVKYGAENPELMHIAREMSDQTDRALQVARNVAENLRPAALDMGIVAALEWLCGKMQAQTGIDCRFRATGELDDMDQAQVDAVFRITQESLTNAMRHAEAHRVAISLALHEDGLHLTVHDDGRGFDPGQPTQRKSFGLAGMEERVRGVGGDFRVTSAPDEGTTVVAHMPYRKSGSRN